MKKLSLFFVIVVLGCAPQQSSIQESEITATIEGFFNSLDAESDEPNKIDEFVTEDFLIYEAGKKMNKQEFMDMVGGFQVTSSDWELSDWKISTDLNSAHVSLLNNGTFEMAMDSLKLRQKYEWLESAYLVKVDDKLKIKFYFSDNIAMRTDTIN